MADTNQYVRLMRELYRNEIFQCLDFWQKNGLDRKYGGILTCLDREGMIFGTDKSVWFQGRSLYTFCKAYNTVEKRTEWLEAAHGVYGF